MDDNQKIQAMSHGNDLWVRIDQNLDKIKAILLKEQIEDGAGTFFYDALKLVSIELITNKKKYDKYPSTFFSEEQLVDVVIESIAQKLPDMDDLEGNKVYNDELRAIMWGHLKFNFKKLFDLLDRANWKPEKALGQEDLSVMEDCLVVVFVEAIVRRREIQILENSYL